MTLGVAAWKYGADACLISLQFNAEIVKGTKITTGMCGKRKALTFLYLARADFCAYMNKVLLSTAKTQQFTPEKLYQLTVNGFVAAFITDEKRAAWLKQVKDAYEEVTRGPAP